MLFCADIRAKTIRENPDASMTELSKILGAKWKELSDAQKKPFNAKYAKAKAVYDKKFAKYKASASYKEFKEGNNVQDLIKKVCKKFNIVCKKRKPTSFPSDPNAPKKSNFCLFLFRGLRSPRNHEESW